MTLQTNSQSKQYPVVALVGRANVGKSTLFNRLIEARKAVTAPMPGTTRDVNYGYCDWRGSRFIVADTGGYITKPETDIEKSIQKQAETTLKKADAVAFVVDAQTGFTPLDFEYLKKLRTFKVKKLLFVANKADSLAIIRNLHDPEWLRAGLGAPLPVSAASGLGIGDFLDHLAELLPDAEREDFDELKIAIIGRTNAGKSSLINKILGEERVIVSPQEHTIIYNDIPIRLIDTVGVRRKSKVEPGVEREGVQRSIDTIKRADIVLFIVDGTVTPTRQESRLVRLAEDAGSGIIMIVNKWDLIEEKDPTSTLVYERYFKEFFSFISWAPVLFVSALTGQRVTKVIDAALKVQKERERVISSNSLQIFLKKAIAKQKPVWVRGRKKPVILGFIQVKAKPPTFALQVKDSTSIQYAYLRYLENRLRERFGFEGTPVRIHTEQV
jgi:GTPase